MPTARPRVAAFTLIEVLIVVAIIGLLMVLAVPNFMRLRSHAQSKACIANLGQMESSKQIWGLETGKAAGDAPSESDLIPTYIKKMPHCPSGGTYAFNPIGELPTCTVDSHTL